MKMSRIVEELERQCIQVTYENIAIFAVFVSDEGLVERLRLNDVKRGVSNVEQSAWLRTLLTE